MYLLYLILEHRCFRFVSPTHGKYIGSGYLPNMRFLLKNLHTWLEVFFVNLSSLTIIVIFGEQL